MATTELTLTAAAAACCAPLAREPLSAEGAELLARALKAMADPARLRLVSIVASSGPRSRIVACDGGSHRRISPRTRTRTPMNAILGMTELALDTPLSDDQRHCLKTVKSAADGLLGIINDLLDFSKIEAGKLELDPAGFSLRDTVGGVLRTLAMRAHRKGLELVGYVHPDVPDALVGDENGGLVQLFAGLNPERIMAASFSNGLARFALGKATSYAKERAVFQGPIGSHQAIAHPLAESHIAIEMARLMTQKAAWATDAGVPGAGEAANMAKYAAAEAAMHAVDVAIQVHGGNGFAAEYGIAGLWWMARVLRTAPVSREMILNYVAEHSLRLPRSY